MNNGRPTKYKPEYCQQAYEQSVNGATIRQLAAFFNVNRDTILEWKKVYPEFRERVEAGKEKADGVIEQSIYQMAKGYITEEVHFTTHKGVVTPTKYLKYHKPDIRAAIFWLCNRGGNDWCSSPQFHAPEEEKPRYIFKLGDKEVEF